jgi:hypothetical protein
MQSHGRYRVVGVRPNGERVVIAYNDTREIAEKVIRLIQFGSPFKELLIEDGPDDLAATVGE